MSKNTSQNTRQPDHIETDPPGVLVNGRRCRSIDCADRGLAYGDGVFETIAIANQRPEFWSQHMDRLHHGCHILNIPPPDPGDLARQIATLCQDMPIQDPPSQAIIKIIVTRGSGGRGYAPPPQSTPTIVLSRHEWPSYPVEWASNGVTIRLCQIRLSQQPAFAGIKHLNRLENILARAEWQDSEIAEGLLCDHHDHLIEGVMSNLFLLRGGIWATPDLESCGVAGVMRQVVLDLAQECGIPMVIRNIDQAELQKAEGLFLTNSIIGIWPVRNIAAYPLPLHPTITDLQTALAKKRVEEQSMDKFVDQSVDNF